MYFKKQDPITQSSMEKLLKMHISKFLQKQKEQHRIALYKRWKYYFGYIDINWNIHFYLIQLAYCYQML